MSTRKKKLSTFAKVTITLSITVGGIEPMCDLDITWKTSGDHGSRLLHIVHTRSILPKNIAAASFVTCI